MDQPAQPTYGMAILFAGFRLNSRASEPFAARLSLSGHVFRTREICLKQVQTTFPPTVSTTVCRGFDLWPSALLISLAVQVILSYRVEPEGALATVSLT